MIMILMMMIRRLCVRFMVSPMEVELTGVQTLAVALVSGSRRLEPHNGGGK